VGGALRTGADIVGDHSKFSVSFLARAAFDRGT